VSRLRETWRRIRATHRLGRDLAVLVALVVLGSGAAAYILAHQRVVWPWEHRVPYRADFVEAPGISPGNGQEVRIAGVRVGDVSRAEITPDGRARLTLSLQKRYGAVFDNARAYLRPKSPLNDMYVLLDPGGPPARRLRPGAVIPVAQTARPIQVDEVLTHLDERSRQALGVLLAESDVAMTRADALPGGLKATDSMLVNLRPVVEALQTRRALIARITTALSDIATAAGEDDIRLARLLASARTTLETLSARDADLDATLAQLPDFNDQLRRSSQAVAALGAELDPALDGVKAASDRLPAALAGLTAVVDHLDGTIDRLRPVVDGAGSLLGDLRPLAESGRAALSDTVAWTPRLDPTTANLVRHLPDVGAFFEHGVSETGLEDANGPILRGLVIMGPETLTSAAP
jgi:phospholipid/cholesterol/gamma-HCH transport system substrate-binding protein